MTLIGAGLAHVDGDGEGRQWLQAITDCLYFVFDRTHV